MNNDTGEWLLNSRVAHIHARREGGPRWDPQMSAEGNRSAENLLPLCIEHASEIDDTPQHYPAELLRGWKQAQLQECLEIQRFWPVDDAQAAEIAAASFDPHQLGIAQAGATTVIAAVRCAGLMLEAGRLQRRSSAQAVDAWNAARDRANRMTRAFDANGERLRVEPPDVETRPLRSALEQALNEAVTVVEGQGSLLIAELHAVRAANPSLRPWCDWGETAARRLTQAAGRWPGRPPEPDDKVWPDAMSELERAAQALADTWRGEGASEPPQFLVEHENGESDAEREVRVHLELLERARPWARVAHRPYDAELYEQLTDTAERVVHLPELPSTLPIGLEATARLAAMVTRNADEATYRALIDRVAERRPLAVAACLLKHLALTAGKQGHGELQETALEKARQLLLDEQWLQEAVWVDNQTHVRRLLAWTALFSDDSSVRATLEAALQRSPDLLPAMLAGMAQWSEPLNDGRGGVERGPSSFIASVPDWFPTSQVAAVIEERMPEVQPADEDASERYTDDTQRYASQVLWLAAGNPPSW